VTGTLKITMITGVIALMAGTFGVLARQGPAARGGEERFDRGHGRMARMAYELDLNDEQRVQFREIFHRYHSNELGELKRTVREARRELRGVIHDPAAGEPQVLEAARKVSAQAEQLALMRHRMTIEIDAILTEEQRQRAKKLHKERLEEREGFHHRRHFGPAQDW